MKSEQLSTRIQQLRVQLARAQARERAHERKVDTRRKILMGAMLLRDAAEGNVVLRRVVADFVSRLPERERSLFPEHAAQHTQGDATGGAQ